VQVLPFIHNRHQQRTYYTLTNFLRNSLSLTIGFKGGTLCTETCLTYFFDIDIQGDSGGICTLLGYDSLSDSKQKSSYEHGSDFERLRSYDRLKLGIEGNDY